MLYRLEHVRCGKSNCRACRGTKGARGAAGLLKVGHGPYWYGYWAEATARRGRRLRKIYVGKTLPTLRPRDAIGKGAVELSAEMDLGPGPLEELARHYSQRRRKRGSASKDQPERPRRWRIGETAWGPSPEGNIVPVTIAKVGSSWLSITDARDGRPGRRWRVAIEAVDRDLAVLYARGRVRPVTPRAAGRS